jgi:non-haem dioxygenase in morphine synthesis N-terminal
MAVKFNTGADSRLNATLLQNLTPSFTEIPVIDITAAPSPDYNARSALAKQIPKASETIGFFYMSNHGKRPQVCVGEASGMRRW